MKKLLSVLIAFCVASVVTLAQSLELSTPDGPLGINDSIMVSGEQTSLLTAYVHVKNTSAASMDVLVKKVVIDTLPGTSNFFCWVQCYGPGTYIAPEFITLASGASTTSFSGDYDPLGVKGVSVIRYVFFDQNNPGDSNSVTVLFNAGVLGMDDEEVSFSAAYPNPAHENTCINYSLPAGKIAGAHLMVRNLLGSEICRIPVGNPQGKLIIPVHEWKEGVYFYSLILNNAALFTRKLVVKK